MGMYQVAIKPISRIAKKLDYHLLMERGYTLKVEDYFKLLASYYKDKL